MERTTIASHARGDLQVRDPRGAGGPRLVGGPRGPAWRPPRARAALEEDGAWSLRRGQETMSHSAARLRPAAHGEKCVLVLQYFNTYHPVAV